MGRRGGEPVTRTMCLSRASGELIKVLDADDMLTPGVLAREIAVMTANPGIGWTTCRVLDLLPEGSTEGFGFDPPEGPSARGSVLEHWRSHDYRAPVHPCIRSPCAFGPSWSSRSAAGWPFPLPVTLRF
jgi:hypothetical protein